MYNGSELIKDYVPSDSCKQTNINNLVLMLFKDNEIKNVLDLGCGKGDSIDFFRN